MRVEKALPNEPKDLLEFFRLLDYALLFKAAHIEDIADDDKQLFKRHCVIDENYNDERLLFDFEGFVNEIKRKYTSGHARVVFGYITMVENVCDPYKNYLDLKPELQPPTLPPITDLNQTLIDAEQLLHQAVEQLGSIIKAELERCNQLNNPKP